MIIHLEYGKEGLPVDFPDGITHCIQPSFVEGLSNEKADFLAALDTPIETGALQDRVMPEKRICIVFTDITRPTPNERIIPWLLDYLAAAGAKRENITLLNSTGSHRPNTREELVQMLTPAVVENYRILNHDCHVETDLVQVGTTRTGARALLNHHLVEADIRIVTGFIEPHFFAGFSGGPKGIMPGVAGLETIESNHGSRNIADENAHFGKTVGNPIWEEMRDIALRAGESFLINATLNAHRHITGIFAGNLIAAHARGIEFVRRVSMQPVDAPFDIVVSTNSGYPLDMNLYQTVKGMRTASLVVKPGGTILMVSKCSEGVPADSPYEELLYSAPTLRDLNERICSPGFSHPEQWQAQILALLAEKADLHLYSELSDETVRKCHLTPCENIADLIREKCGTLNSPRICVLPEGPQTIPYLHENARN